MPALDVNEERVFKFVGERRRFARRRVAYEVQLPVGVSLPNDKLDPEMEEYPRPIFGKTHDISESGLSLLLPSIHLGHEQIDVPGYPLRVVLCLPFGLIIVQAVTVRCERVGESPESKSYLIGAQIKSMSEYDRNRYKTFLQSFG